MVLEQIANLSGRKALQVQILHPPPPEGTSMETIGLENRGW